MTEPLDIPALYVDIETLVEARAFLELCEARVAKRLKSEPTMCKLFLAKWIAAQSPSQEVANLYPEIRELAVEAAVPVRNTGASLEDAWVKAFGKPPVSGPNRATLITALRTAQGWMFRPANLTNYPEQADADDKFVTATLSNINRGV